MRFDDIYFIRHSHRARGLAFGCEPERGYYLFVTHLGTAYAGPFETRSEARKARRDLLAADQQGA